VQIPAPSVAAAAPLAEHVDTTVPAAASMASVSTPQEQPAEQPAVVDIEHDATAVPSPAEPAGEVAFALEPAVVARAETAVVGLPAAGAAQEPDAAPGLFDTAQVGTVADPDPVEAAANAVAEHADDEPVHGDNERSA
jgi:hypothetical protein